MILLSGLLLHLFLIYLRGYFLSAEFTLYPYLVSHGFLPYQNIYDQHFPTLLFGPFSLPSFLTTNPWPLLGLFLLTLCLTDCLLYLSLIRFKVKKPLVWLVFYIITSVYFSGYILWLETFVNLLLSLYLFLSFSSGRLQRFTAGFLLSQIFLLRPTIAPAIFFLVLFLSNFSLWLILGNLIGLAIPALFLYRFGLYPDFYSLAIRFNQSIYPTAAKLLPNLRQLFMLLLWFIPAGFALFQKRKPLFLLILLFLSVLAIPRFGYEHLQPLFLMTVVFYALVRIKPDWPVYLLILLFFVLNLISGIRHPYGNYFLPPEVVIASQKIKTLPGSTIYLLGAPDLLYPLSDKLPPNFTYVPSLPWYLHQYVYVQKIIDSLINNQPPVIIYPQAEIDGQNTLRISGRILKHIQDHYLLQEKIGPYDLYLPKP